MKQLRRTVISTFSRLGSLPWKLAYNTVSPPSCSVYQRYLASSWFQAQGSGFPAIHSSKLTVSYSIRSFRNTAPVCRTVGAKYQSPQTIVV